MNTLEIIKQAGIDYERMGTVLTIGNNKKNRALVLENKIEVKTIGRKLQINL